MSSHRQDLKKLDKSDMLGLLLDFPRQFEAALDIAGRVSILFEKRDFTKIIFVGLGGSAIGGDLIRAYLYFESKAPVCVLREYELPAYADSAALVFILSYSGNTEEALSAYRSAKENGSALIAISSGGALEEYAASDGITFARLPPGLPPRCALGYLSTIPLCILAKLGLIKEAGPAVAETARVLSELRDGSLTPRLSRKDNPAKYAAARIKNKFAFIYAASVHFDVCATRFRSQLNENAKTLAASHLFPEMNHGEIVGWQNPAKLLKKFTAVFLRDKGMHPAVARRMDITRDILRKEGIEAIEIWSRGQGLLSRIFSLMYIGDFVSYYLALLYGIDPAPVEKIDYLKKELAK